MQHTFSAIAVFTVASVVACAPVQVLANDGAHGLEAGQHGPHIFEIFLGGTFSDHHGRDEQAFSIGAQYRYAMSEIVSARILADYSGSPFDVWLVGIPFIFNLGETAWQFTAMPGTEFESGEEEFLFRTGIGFEIEMKQGHSIKPEINVDWINGETSVVPDASIGWRF